MNLILRLFSYFSFFLFLYLRCRFAILRDLPCYCLCLIVSSLFFPDLYRVTCFIVDFAWFMVYVLCPNFKKMSCFFTDRTILHGQWISPFVFVCDSKILVIDTQLLWYCRIYGSCDQSLSVEKHCFFTHRFSSHESGISTFIFVCDEPDISPFSSILYPYLCPFSMLRSLVCCRLFRIYVSCDFPYL